jgi:hypothetical protein
VNLHCWARYCVCVRGILKLKALFSPESSVPSYKNTRRENSRELELQLTHAFASRTQLIFSLLPLFWKIKLKVSLWDHHAVCVSVYHPLLTYELLNQFLWNFVCVSWQLSPSQRLTLWILPISLCVCLSVPCLLGYGSVKIIYRGNECTSNNRRIVQGVVLCAVRVVLKESRRLVLPRNSCCWFVLSFVMCLCSHSGSTPSAYTISSSELSCVRFLSSVRAPRFVSAFKEIHINSLYTTITQ